MTDLPNLWVMSNIRLFMCRYDGVDVHRIIASLRRYLDNQYTYLTAWEHGGHGTVQRTAWVSPRRRWLVAVKLATTEWASIGASLRTAMAGTLEYNVGRECPDVIAAILELLAHSLV